MNDKLQQIDARAMAVNMSLSALAAKARVSSATIARWYKGGTPKLRTANKLEATLDQLEAEKRNGNG